MSSGIVALDAPLQGLHLIEASAGTGKTWTLSGLYLRLVLERGLAPREILTLTFTKAATAELRERVRRRLQDMLDLLDGAPVSDAICQALQVRLPDRDCARKRLVAALRGLDEAAIHTIHGFCQRVLADRSFSAGTDFAAEIVQDPQMLLRELVLDHWRRAFADPAAVGFGAWVQAQGQTPDTLLAWVRELVGKPQLALHRGPDAPDLAPLRARYDGLRSQCLALWQAQRPALLDLLSRHPGLNRTTYRVANLPKYFDELEAWFADPAELLPPDRWPLFTPSRLSEKSGGQPPRHAFFDCAGELAAVAEALDAGYAARWRSLRLDLLLHLRDELPRQLRARRQQSYDDLLRNLHAALHGTGGERLAQDLRLRYPAALIDEFQDTDPLQWGILRRLYVEAPGEAALAAYLVGDPKQAIYSFRGADIVTYLQAAACCTQRHELLENQRSIAGYLAALNALYAGAVDPFRHAGIRSTPVRAAPRPKPVLRQDGADDPAPLRLVAGPADDSGKPLAVGKAERWACEAVAGEIANLLGAAAAGQVSLGGRALRAGDIAVLVNAHYQASALREALARRGIACAVRSNEGVFQSEEAAQLERLLLAITHPQREGLVRAALADGLLGRDAAELQRLRENQAEADDCLNRFSRYQALWRDQGFMRLLRELLQSEGIAARLGALPDGERRLTNLLHLGELLQADAAAAQGPEALLARLAAARSDRVSEEAQLRLESDAGLVQLVTIHGSKGLEYPVCFLPFLWRGRKATDADIVLHHAAESPHDLMLEADPARIDPARAQAREESLGEALRLAYVALTRASHRAYLYCGPFAEIASSPLGLLLYGLRDPAAPTPAAAAGQAALEALQARAPTQIRIESPEAGAAAPIPTPNAAAAPQARVLAQRVPAGLQLSSYTALLNQAQPQALHELPDHDQRAAASLMESDRLEPGGSRERFPRGAAAGVCLHAILEHLDARAEPAQWESLIRTQLRAAGYPAEWTPELRDWMQAVVLTPLGEGLSLSALDPARCIAEMAFHLPLGGVAPAALSACIQAGGLPVSDLALRRIEGYLRGFIDLVFEHDGRWYVADYKSNWLGPSAADYGPDSLDRAMAGGDYVLQYLLYTVALHRWLRTRLPDYHYERHVGGVRYLFLRGMSPQHGSSGVHVARPSFELVAALDALLAGVPP